MNEWGSGPAGIGDCWNQAAVGPVAAAVLSAVSFVCSRCCGFVSIRGGHGSRNRSGLAVARHIVVRQGLGRLATPEGWTVGVTGSAIGLRYLRLFSGLCIAGLRVLLVSCESAGRSSRSGAVDAGTVEPDGGAGAGAGVPLVRRGGSSPEEDDEEEEFESVVEVGAGAAGAGAGRDTFCGSRVSRGGPSPLSIPTGIDSAFGAVLVSTPPGSHLPVPIHGLCTLTALLCRALFTVNRPRELPVRSASYTVPASNAIGTGSALYAEASQNLPPTRIATGSSEDLPFGISCSTATARGPASFFFGTFRSPGVISGRSSCATTTALAATQENKAVSSTPRNKIRRCKI